MKSTHISMVLGFFALTLLAGSGQVAAIPLPDNSSCNVGGNTNTCLKITNTAISGSAITAITTGGIGALKASSTNGIGIQTSSTSNVGLYATSGSGIGIQATSTSNFGISALSGNSWAINASSSGVRPLGAVMGHANGLGYGVVGQNLNIDSGCRSGNGLNCAAAIYGDAGGNITDTWAGLFNGDLNIVGNLYVNNISFTSDSRKKKDIKDAPFGVEQVLKLRPVTFKWNQTGWDDRTHIGFIAQEVQKVIPELVGSRGNSDTLTLNYTGLIPVLIRAAQEQEAVIRQQEARLAILEQRRDTVASSSGGLGAMSVFGLLPLGLIGFVVGRRRKTVPVASRKDEAAGGSS
jgi:hypothetical protein